MGSVGKSHPLRPGPSQARECIADVSALFSGPAACLVNLSCSCFSGSAGQRLGLADFLHHMGVGTISARHRAAAAACFGFEAAMDGPNGTRGGRLVLSISVFVSVSLVDLRGELPGGPEKMRSARGGWRGEG